MKKIFVSLILMVGLFSLAFSADPTYTNPNVYVSQNMLDVTTKDTIVSSSDSQIVSSSFAPEAAYNYYLTNNVFTGASTDSVDLKIYAICYNSSGTVKAQILIDSITGALTKPILLPFNNGLFGSTFKIYAKGGAGVGGELITNGWQIWKQRPLGIEKKTW